MKILIDADACPVIKNIEKIAKKWKVPVIIISDYHHQIHSDYSEVVIVDPGADAVDFALMKMCEKEDVVVTQDYGVAAMALGKGCASMNQNGKRYTNENIDLMLMERHLSKTARRKNTKFHTKGPKKRSPEDDQNFEYSFEKLLIEILDRQGGISIEI